MENDVTILMDLWQKMEVSNVHTVTVFLVVIKAEEIESANSEQELGEDVKGRSQTAIKN